MSPVPSPDPVSLLVVEAGERPVPVTLDGVAATHDVRQLVRSLGRPPESPVRVDGHRIGGTSRLSEVLVEGAVVELGAEADQGGRDADGVVDIVWLLGPDAGRRVGLRPGRYVLGRSARGPLRTADPAMAPRHAVLEVHADGSVLVTDLGIGRPLHVDRSPVTGPCRARAGARLRVGASVLELAEPAHLSHPALPAASVGRAGWTRPYLRAPRRVAHDDPALIVAPADVADASSGPSVIGVLSLAVPLLGGLVMAAIFRQPLLLVMVGLGALGGIVTWLVQASQARRGRRSSRRRRAEALASFEEAVRARWTAAAASAASYPSLEVLAAGASTGSELWGRRAAHGDAFTIAVGIGDVPWEPPVSAPVSGATARSGATNPDVVAVIEQFAVLPEVAVTMELRPGTAIGIAGDPTTSAALARALITQLAVTTGPADWELLVAVADDVTGWSWVDWLPHGASSRAVVRFTDLDTEVRARMASSDSSERRLVVVVDGTAPLTARTSPLRRLFAARADAVTLVVIAPDVLQLPVICGTVVETAADGSVALCEPDALPQRAHAVGCSEHTALLVAAALARWRDPELDAGEAGVPASVDLLDLFDEGALRPAGILARWESGGADPAPVAPLGLAADGAVEIDLAADGPHALVAGTTGAGKSELLRSLVAGMAMHSSPAALSFLLIDYKGGSAFDACARLPHVVGVVTDLDDRLAERVIRGLEAELRRRERLLRDAGAADLTAYRANGGAEPIARLVVVIDEFAALAAELPEFLHTLVNVAQRGRSLGVHLVLATQRPSGVLSDDIRANTNLRIALRVQDAADAVDIVGDPAPVGFARTAPGRAAARLGGEALVVLQAARCTGPAPDAGGAQRRHLTVRAGGPARAVTPEPEPGGEGPDTVLDEVVRAVEAAAVLGGVRRPYRPWLAPLPAELSARDLPVGVVGLLDDPDRQAQASHRWDPACGHLVLAGALGTGTTTALVSIAHAVAAQHSARELHLYALDAGSGAELATIEHLPHTGAVVRLADVARRRRLLHRLNRILDERAASADVGGATVVVLIDGFASVRSALLDAGGDEIDDLERLVQDGPQHGLVVVATIDQPSAAPLALLARAGERWVFRLADHADAVALGVPMARVPAVNAPPGRCVVSSSGLEMQVGLPVAACTATPGARPCSGGPQPIAERPPVLRIDHLAPTPAWRGATVVLPLAVADSSGEPEVLHLHHGDHAMVLGPPRSGRTSTLVTIVEQWRRAVPGGWVGVVQPRDGDRGLRGDAGDHGPTERLLGELAAALVQGPALLVVDDAELVADEAGTLAALVAADRPGLHVVAAGRPDVLRSTYGHWTAAVRRSRKGVLLGALHDLDGDLLGVLLPRRMSGRPRPGDGYLVADGLLTAVQVATLAPA